MAKPSPLHKVTDGDRWDAEDLFGRLCLVVHAAFLHAGFHPHGALAATTAWSLSRRYTALPQPAAAATELREDAAAVVLRLSRRRRSSIALRSYIASSNGGRCIDRRGRLDRSALAAVLSGGVDDAARALVTRTPGSATSGGEWLWNLLFERVCRDLFVHACEANGVALVPGFASIHGDLKTLILAKVDDGKDLAMAVCASKELRDLAAGHDRELWKGKYEAVPTACPHHLRPYLVTDEDTMTPFTTWKERYTTARRSVPMLLKWPPAAAMVAESIWRQRLASVLRRCPEERRDYYINLFCPEMKKSAMAAEAAEKLVLVQKRRAALEEQSQRRRAAGRSMVMIGKTKVHSMSSRYQCKHI